MSVQSTFKTAKNTSIALGSVLIPLIFFRILWPYVEKYWRLLVSVLSASSGIVFLIFYFKAYTPKTIWQKVRAYFSEKELITEYMAKTFGKTEVLERSKDFLYIGIFLLFLAAYFLYQYFTNIALTETTTDILKY